MLKFECYTFNFHVWLHALAAATPQRDAAQARKTIISIGRVTKMLNLLLNSHHRRLHLTKSFSKPPQKAHARRGRFWERLSAPAVGKQSQAAGPATPPPPEQAGAAAAEGEEAGPGCRQAERTQPLTNPAWLLSNALKIALPDGSASHAPSRGEQRVI